MAAIVIAGTVAGGSTLFSAPAQAATPDSGAASAYGINVKLFGGNVLGPIPTVTLGADGASSGLSQTLPVDVPGLITANTLNADTSSTNFGTAAESISATAGVEGLSGLNGASLLNTLLDVQAVNTSCTSNAAGSTGSTTIVGLSIGGAAPLDLPSPIPPNTGLTAAELGPLAGLVTITLNAQTGQDRPAIDGTDLDVIGIQITLLSVLDKGAVINVANSACAATGSDIEAVPSITSLTPHVGPAAGGTTVTIDGSGFTPSSAVDFANVPSTDVTYVSSTQITAVSPPATDQSTNSTVPVTVSDAFGFGPATASAANDFTYEVTPSLTTITPIAGPTSGGQTVTLTGANFGPDTTVAFGMGSSPAQATNVVVNPDGTSLTAVTPAHAAGVVDVTVADAGGSTTLTNAYTYVSANVVVSGIVPDVGPTSGGTSVTISGAGFTDASSVTFGGIPATTFTAVNDTTITATSPPHAVGTVDVIVTSPGGSSFPVTQDEFTYESTPTISTTNGIVPDTGPVAGGTAVTITGTGFGPDSVVSFGGSDATDVVVVSADEITAVSPASPLSGNGAGPVNVTVADAGGTSNPVAFTYVAGPIISPNGINPDMGSTVGGTPVTITGSNFVSTGTVVTFAGNDATNVVVVSPDEITAVSPAGVAGPANVVVSDPYGTSAPQIFTYVAPPVVGADGLDPAFGPVAGGTTVHITGTNLTGTSSVVFGASACAPSGATGGASAPITSGSVTATTVTVTSPASPLSGNGAGPVSVCITAAGGTSVAAEPFTYEVAPVISATGLSPTSGPVGGGTKVTITGSNFAVGDPSTAVDFGANAATDVVVVSGTEITAVTPASTLPGSGAGAVPVTVSDAGGGPVTAAQQFTYLVAPVISGISPTSGPQSGGETVIIKGTDLCGTTSVLFGTASATIQSISTDCTTVEVTEPPGTGTVPVFLTAPGGTVQSPENFTYIEPGYWEAASDGGVFSFGGAQFYGSVPGALKPGQSLNSPIVAMADTPDHGGYWLFAADGGVFSFGDAKFFGSVPGVLPGVTLNGPVVTAEATPDGGGYRMFAADGGVFDFGDAQFRGSLPGEHITPSAPITGATAYPFGEGANPDNGGYWLVAADGSIFPFANAPANLGSGKGLIFGQVVSLATTPSGNGYYMFLADGPVAHFGDATPGLGGASNPPSPIIFGQSTSTGKGYWEFAANGAVYTYGDAPFEGSLQITLNKPITAGIAFGSTPIGA